jgi:sulfoxide reductase catalytic subunit YedY
MVFMLMLIQTYLSQNSERQLGGSFFTPRRQTELFNGYADQVASLYGDMDLRRFF